LLSKGKLRWNTSHGWNISDDEVSYQCAGVPRQGINARHENPNLMKMKICFALTIAAALAACRLQAQGTLSATATIIETGKSASDFEYSLTLTNTGSNPINAFWYGWTVGSFNLPTVPSGIAGPTGWSGSAVGNSIQYQNNTGSAIAPGGTGIFTFKCTSTLTAMTTGIHQGDPTGESVAYATVSAMNACDQSDPGIASNPFTPTLPLPSLQAPSVVAGSLQLAWTSVSGLAYQVQYSTNLAQTNWINLGSSITATNSATTTNDAIGSGSLRFYRVVASP
jgi:hypothetical protein